MNQVEIAEALGTTQASVSNWTKEGMPHRQKGQRASTTLAACLAWAIEHLKPIKPAGAVPRMAPAAQTSAPPVADLALVRGALAAAATGGAAWIALVTRCTVEQAVEAWIDAADILLIQAADLVGVDALDAMAQPGPRLPGVAAVAAEIERLRREFDVGESA